MLPQVVQKVLDLSGIASLNPVQKKALDMGLLDDGNMVVAAPTASGKTLVAEFAALDAIKKNKKVVYIVPLKALATEKFEEFKEKYENLGIKVGISIGDMDSTDPWLANYDLIIVTSEKLDSLIRHGIPWAEMIGLVVVDEVHLLDSPNRGPTLEIVLTRLIQLANPKILALSATINNYKELASWLNAKALKSDYRPVKLYSGVYHEGTVNFQPNKKLELIGKDEPINELISEVLSKNKQSLVFVSTRRSAESVAYKIGNYISNKLSSDEKVKLEKLSEKVMKILDHPTKQCEKIADCVKNGTAFHHAGLTSKQRKLIETSFREGLLKVITATPTLSFGLNLPAYRVIIRDLKRFSSFSGMIYLPTLEIMQMAGRAGRPKYDNEGEAILIAKNKNEATYAWDNYIIGDPEDIYSKLGVEPVLRTHVLALISSGVTPDKNSLFDFFSKTFYAHQKGDILELKIILERVLASLQQFRVITIGDGEPVQEDLSDFKSAASMITQGEELKPTRIGKRVSELYIDPMTANHLIEKLQYADKKGTSDFGILQLISNTVEMKPLLSMKKGDMEMINDIIVKEESSLTDRMPTPWDIEYDDFLCSIKTAAMFKAWIEEAGENKIHEAFAVTPGELHARLSNSDWLLYSAQELALLLGLKDVIKDIRKLRIRVKNGIKEELLPLVRLKGIGRVRARTLYNFGITSVDALRKSPQERVAKLVGEKMAQSIKEQLGETK
ncbi:MAG: DEAD/DEAH box helicase [Nanoarchaeota archaeon]